MAAGTQPGDYRDERFHRFVERITLGRAVTTVIVVAVGITVLGAGLLRILNPAAFPTFGDATWLAVITVTTVGYGDLTPSNEAGRWVAGCIALLGISLIPALTSLVVTILITQRSKREDERQEGERQELLAALEQIEGRLERLEAPGGSPVG